MYQSELGHVKTQLRREVPEAAPYSSESDIILWRGDVGNEDRGHILLAREVFHMPLCD